MGERPAAIVRKLRAFQLELGAAREWDVLIQESIGTMPKQLRAQKSFIELINSAEAKRTKEHRRARDALDDLQCTDLLLELTSWVDRRFGGTDDEPAPPQKAPCQTIADFAAQLLKARRRKVRKLGKKIGKLDTAQLHELRIRIKKLRYAVEFFRDLWRGARVKKYLSTLKHLQNSLGTAHDAMVSSRLIMDLAASQKHKDKFMESRLADWAAACFESELKNTDHLLQKLLRFKPLARTQG
jgi:CHAD domain-containing protein